MAEIVKDLDFWRMAAMGMFVKTVMWGRKEATMYSYNGVVLPGLPESEYEYAVIVQKADGEYVLGFGAAAEIANKYGNVTVLSTTPTYKVENGAWVENGSAIATPIWANHDIYYGTGDDYGELSGTLRIAASDPVPV